jgi:hypothetical protein
MLRCLGSCAVPWGLVALTDIDEVAVEVGALYIILLGGGVLDFGRGIPQWGRGPSPGHPRRWGLVQARTWCWGTSGVHPRRWGRGQASTWRWGSARIHPRRWGVRQAHAWCWGLVGVHPRGWIRLWAESGGDQLVAYVGLSAEGSLHEVVRVCEAHTPLWVVMTPEGQIQRLQTEGGRH